MRDFTIDELHEAQRHAAMALKRYELQGRVAEAALVRKYLERLTART